MVRRRRGTWLLAPACAALALAACAPPGGELEDRATSATGERSRQLPAPVPEDAQRCRVRPPDLELREVKLGFAQSENNNPFRIAETESLREEAQRRGVELVVTDAQSSTPKQVADMQDMVALGVDLIIVPPREELGLTPALETAREAGVPVIFVDRRAEAEPCRDFLTFIGSDFVEQGRRAARWLAEATDGRAKVAELMGTVGRRPRPDRGEGFAKELERHEGSRVRGRHARRARGDRRRDLGAR